MSLLVLARVVGVAITASVGGGEVVALALVGEVEVSLAIELGVGVVSLANEVEVEARLIAVTVAKVLEGDGDVPAILVSEANVRGAAAEEGGAAQVVEVVGDVEGAAHEVCVPAV